jgi:hypothetical protein
LRKVWLAAWGIAAIAGGVAGYTIDGPTGIVGGVLVGALLAVFAYFTP